MSDGRSDTTWRYDLDWHRVLAITTVNVFRSGRFFDTDDWHVKNPRGLSPLGEMS